MIVVIKSRLVSGKRFSTKLVSALGLIALFGCGDDTAKQKGSTVSADSSAMPEATDTVAEAGLAPPPSFEQALREADPDRLGLGRKCLFDGGPRNCRGFRRGDGNGNGWEKNTTGLVKALSNSGLFGDSVVANLPSGQRLTLARISDAAAMDVSLLGGKRAIIARITANMEQIADSPYGLGRGMDQPQNAQAWTGVFYVVIKDYVPDRTARDYSYGVSKWSLLGVATSSGNEKLVLRPTGKNGTLRLCAHAHPTSQGKKGAEFQQCNTAFQSMMLMQDSSIARAVAKSGESSVVGLLRRQLPASPSLAPGIARATFGQTELEKFMKQNQLTLTSAQQSGLLYVGERQDEYIGWVTCGLGCCVVEPDGASK